MREDTQQGVAGQPLAVLHGHQQHRQQHAAGGYRQGDIDLQQHAQRHTQQRRVRQGIAKVGHAPPDHEGAQRPRHQCQSETGNQSIEKKVRHGCRQIRPGADGGR